MQVNQITSSTNTSFFAKSRDWGNEWAGHDLAAGRPVQQRVRALLENTMSMHKKPATPLEVAGLGLHGLPVGEPSQLADVFRQGLAYGVAAERERCAQWLRDNYQDYPNIAGLCDAMVAPGPTSAMSGGRFSQSARLACWALPPGKRTMR